MPDVQRLMDQLTTRAHEAMPLAVVWHIVIAGVLIALYVGWQPRRRLAALLIPLPLLTASAVAWISGDVLQGAISLALVCCLWLAALRLVDGAEPVRTARPLNGFAGLALIGVGLFYPHYLPPGSALDYLYAAPAGVLPGASLLLVLGFTLLEENLLSKTWALVVALGCLLHGVFGAGVLGVSLDISLVLGAVLLLGSLYLPGTEPETLSRRPSRRRYR